MKRAVTYTKEMRKLAKDNKEYLITIDVPGICYQGAVSHEKATEASQMIFRWIKRDSESRPSP